MVTVTTRSSSRQLHKLQKWTMKKLVKKVNLKFSWLLKTSLRLSTARTMKEERVMLQCKGR